MEQAGSLTDSVETGIETMLRAGQQTVEARCLTVFLYLQVLDLLTTLVGLRLGLQEMSPFLRWLMQVGPAVGLLIAKSAAFLLAAICFATHRQRVVYRINYFFAGLVLWNLILIVTAR